MPFSISIGVGLALLAIWFAENPLYFGVTLPSGATQTGFKTFNLLARNADFLIFISKRNHRF
jgi:hypothetical protein